MRDFRRGQPVPSGRSAAEMWALAGRSEEAVLEARTAGPLVGSKPAAGDTFRPLGCKGRKKLQDLFVDAKVDRAGAIQLL